mmetsp:Transcript_29824/g.96216  ORF Transcript_29824/g.96216 Transcript_29824/m.96216 type:complete len:251 (+) Transcript_29824:131-883(+)
MARTRVIRKKTTGGYATKSKKARALERIKELVPRVRPEDVPRKGGRSSHRRRAESRTEEPRPRKRQKRQYDDETFLPRSFGSTVYDLVSVVVPVVVGEERRLGLKLKDIDGRAVIRGGDALESSTSHCQVNDVVISAGAHDFYDYAFGDVVRRINLEKTRAPNVAFTLARPHYDRSLHRRSGPQAPPRGKAPEAPLKAPEAPAATTRAPIRPGASLAHQGTSPESHGQPMRTTSRVPIRSARRQAPRTSV